MEKLERLFVGNLPDNIVEQEIKNEFSAYGTVQSVELKRKHDVDDPNKILNTFAFITIKINTKTLNQCVQEFKDEKFRGKYLQVSVARENFLDKLKREREEAAEIAKQKLASNPKIGSNDDDDDENSKKKIALPVIDKDVSSSSSDDSSEDENEQMSRKPIQVQKQYPPIPANKHDDDDDNNIIWRKKSKTYLENGMVKMEIFKFNQ